MGRGRGKGKKQTVIASHEDPASGEEEKVPAYRRRGRPTKPLKDDNEEEEEIVEIKEDAKDSKDSISSKDVKNHAVAENGRKRKRPALIKENSDSVKETNVVGTKLSTDNSIVNIGFRQNGSRRKNKPRRAAEAVVECK
ncbi:uncharacterized protein LOC110622344 [Manihot esculenta]|uniref:Uncharacterized protein n=3 Tax=Manihot esculenta TaxID=3983 RepID=A0ACB7H483_MANES|nr:uncharacterized protein LOC110622344 [Manihot esculenta]KAG8646834.1 hypothetical protein MANES_09G032900v8 [Manihot esculenta]KAG8646835.1 hypothetical protein MANES_09G032900v8 [Manihot esculenta]OAY40576.1 hypothetical protein MANES_09G032900v8 [Manihot esculenta]